VREMVTAFLPCRKGSERVIHKNTRPFAGEQDGLFGIKLRQLLRCSMIDEIVVSADDSSLLALAEKEGKQSSKTVRVCERPEHLARSDTSTDALIAYVPEIINEGTVLWTHVTSPFVDEHIYTDALKTFLLREEKRENDSLMSVTRLQTFIWNQAGPVNYNREDEKWPRTQTLPIWHEVNSALFIAPIDVYHHRHDRIGTNPFLYDLSFPASIDIDTEDQFTLAEGVWQYVEKD